MNKLKTALAFLVTALLLLSPAAALTVPEIDAASAIVVEKTTGETLFEQNADEKRGQASITKVMTALVALEYGDPNSIITVNQSALKGLPEMGSSVYLIAGEEMAFMDMLRYVLIASGNDGSNALAEHISGTQEEFVALMNTMAKSLGMSSTQYMNTHGLTQEGHYTTARDTVKLCMEAMDNKIFREIVCETEVVLPVTNKHAETTRRFTTNYLLSVQSQSGYRYEGAEGVKTGNTTAAGRCLASSLRKDDLWFFTVVLGGREDDGGKLTSFTETIKLFDFVSDSYAMQTMLKSTEPITTIPLRLAADKETVQLQPENSVTALLPKDFAGLDDPKLELIIEAQVEGVDAPVEIGQSLGHLTVKYDGRVYANMDLVSAETIARSEVLHVIDNVSSFFSSTTFKVIIGAIFGVIALFIGYVFLVNHRRKKRRQRYGRRVR